MDNKPLDYIFKPKSIALIGVPRSRGKIGGQILYNLVQGGFNGKIFPVNPGTDTVQCFKSYASVIDIPDPVDMAVITVSSDRVLKSIDECGKKGVKGVVVITAGFKEVGKEGAQLELQVLKKVKEYGMRMVGPNCVGVINTNPDVAMNAAFATNMPLPGKIAFMSQSGALGVAVLNYTIRMRIGISYFVSLGNIADVCDDDILEYWKDDPDAKIIICYLENFKNPGKFAKLAKEITKTKPILIVKAGKTSAGAKAASSHTGALAANLDVAVDTLLEESGCIRVPTVEALFDVARFLLKQPVPKSNRVAILTNAGGPGIMATDAAAGLGLEISSISDSTKAGLRKVLPPYASVENPVDMIGTAEAEQYCSCLKLLLEDGNVDAVHVIFVLPLFVNPIDIANAIIKASSSSSKPVVASIMNTDENGEKAIKILEDAGIPMYRFSEAAVYSLVTAAKYHRAISKPAEEIKPFVVETPKGRTIIENARSQGRTNLFEEEIRELLGIYNIPFASSIFVKDIDGALKAADQLGYPVVLKAKSRRIIHKTEFGGVKTDIRNEKELREAYTLLTERLKDKKDLELDGFTVQEMLVNGKEVVIGMVSDPSFGPLIMFGMGGIYVEIFKDIQFRINPISRQKAKDMIESTKSYNVLAGARGEKGVDLEFLVECIQRVSQMVTENPELCELDLNPFIVSFDRSRCKCVDARASITAFLA